MLNPFLKRSRRARRLIADCVNSIIRVENPMTLCGFQESLDILAGKAPKCRKENMREKRRIR